MKFKEGSVRGRHNKNRTGIHFLCRAAVIAALYVILTELSAAVGLSSFLRGGECLCALCCVTAAAVPGVTVGCFLSNLLMGAPAFDLLFGTLATLAGAVGGYLLRRVRYLAPMPTVLANALTVPWILRTAYGLTRGYWVLFGLVGGGEVLTAYVLGLTLVGCYSLTTRQSPKRGT